MVTDKKNEPQQKKEQVLRTFETISQRVRRHISDIRSEITDEDIRNVKIEFEVKNTTYDFRHAKNELTRNYVEGHFG
jgi:hypothetical protein